MKRLVTLAAIALLACSVSFAQGESTVRRTAGSNALLFTLNGLADLSGGDFMGGMGFNHFLSNDVALRAGVGFGMASLTSGTGTAEDKASTTTINVAPGIRFNLANNSNVAMYVGGQVMFGMSSTSNTLGGANDGSTSSTSIGVGAFAGAEWFPWNNVSLGLEYGLGLTTSSSSDKDAAGVETAGPTFTSIDLGITNVQFTLALYFN